MAEVLAILGGLSSVLQIADFTAKLVGHARELINSDHDALREVRETEQLAIEYESLAEILQHAGPLKQTWNPDSKTPEANHGLDSIKSRASIKKLAAQCQKEAKTILELIEDLRMTAAFGGWKRLTEGSKKALRYLKKKRKLKVHLDTLQQNGAALRLALQTAAHDKSNLILHAIIRALAFEGVDQREQNIAEAYPQTYQWALNQESFGIRTWLSSNSSIFWVTGKPGSGKSTLMKFLYNSPQTKAYLQQWAGNSRLVISRFYFWYLGTVMQTSTEGLLRSILYQIITELPELARTAFPDHFEAEDNPFHPPEFDYADLNNALRRLATAANEGHTRKKLCFFIDGLDEFRGDHIGLVDLLNELSQRYEIKLLISSRPWTVFSRAYEGIVPHLRLEDVTKDDIHLYVHNNVLSAISSTQALVPSYTLYEHDEIKNLVKDVAGRAEGVFLWVYLVVQQIRKGVAEGDGPSTLRLRVQSFPPDLNKFFKELIYDRVDEVYAQQTSQALMLAMVCVQENTELANQVFFLDYWLIPRCPMGFADPDFPWKWKPLPGPMTSSELQRAAQETRQFLSSRCKDLLVMQRQQIVNDKMQVTFLHRTVFDFLQTAEIHDILVAQAPEFMQCCWILHLLAWSKLELLHDYSREAPVINALLGTFHSRMSESSINVLLAYIEKRGSLSSLKLCTEALITLAAYQKYDTLSAYEYHNQMSLFWSDAQALPEIEDRIVAALLGMSHVRRFGPEHIDLGLLSRNVQQYRSIAQGYFPDESQFECSNTSWQLLLGRCCDESRSPGDLSAARMERLWEAAKIFIQARAPLSQVFCEALIHPGVPHFHSWVKAEDFLKTHAPPEIKSMVIPIPTSLDPRSKRFKDPQALEEQPPSGQLIGYPVPYRNPSPRQINDVRRPER